MKKKNRLTVACLNSKYSSHMGRKSSGQGTLTQRSAGCTHYPCVLRAPVVAKGGLWPSPEPPPKAPPAGLRKGWNWFPPPENLPKLNLFPGFIFFPLRQRVEKKKSKKQKFLHKAIFLFLIVLPKQD